MIQPPPSGEDAGDTTEFEPGTISTEGQKKKKKEKKPKKDKKTKHKKQATEQPPEETPQTMSQVLQQLKRDHKSQVQSSKPSETATRPEAPGETPASSELSMPSFTSEIPEDWQELAKDTLYNPSQLEPPLSQVTAETTSDTGRAEHPTVTQKVPQKFFHQMEPIEEEEEVRVVTLPPLSTSTAVQLLKEGLELEKVDGAGLNFHKNVMLI